MMTREEIKEKIVDYSQEHGITVKRKHPIKYPWIFRSGSNNFS